MYCHNCGNEIPGNSKFCPECGAKLDGADTCPSCGAKVEA